MLLEQVTIQIKKQQLLNKGISNEIIDKLLQADPTNKDKNDNDKVGSYTDWIVSRYLKDRTFNDFDKLHSQLEQYDKSKHKIPDPKLRNISQFKTLNDLIMYINNNQDKLNVAPTEFIIEEKNDYDMFYSKNFIIHVPHTKEQSIKLGSGTKWCTSQVHNNYFQSYYNEGYLFYITNKTTTQKRYNLFLNEIRVNNIEFADDKNKHLTYKLFDIVKEDNTLIPQIKSYYEYKNIKPKNITQMFLDCKTVSDVVEWWKTNISAFADIYFEKNETKLLNTVEDIGSSIKFIPNPSPKLQLQQLTKDINNINYIESPDNIVLKTLVSQDGEYIKYIIKAGIRPNHDIQLQQVSQNGYQIAYIIDAGIIPEHDVQLQQVSQNGYQIGDILDAGIKPEHDIQLQQVSQNGHQIQCLIDAGIKPKHDVQLQQVSQNGKQIEYIINAGVQPEDENEWHDIQLQQVSQSGYQIKYIINTGIKPEYDVQLQQVTRNGYQIEYIIYAGVQPENENEWHEIQLQQVTQDGHQIKDIINVGIKPEHDVQLQQVTQTGLQIQYIENPTEDIQLQQIKQNPIQCGYIKNPTPQQIQLYNQLKGIKESTGYIFKLLDVN